MADVRTLLMKKAEKKANTTLTMKDVNRDLIIALLAVPVYGKEARDEEILSIIINAGRKMSDKMDILMDRIRENYDRRVADKKIKKTKIGTVDEDGYLVLVPRR